MHTSPYNQLLNSRSVWMLQEFLKPWLSCIDLVINQPRCFLLVIAQSIQGLSLRFSSKVYSWFFNMLNNISGMFTLLKNLLQIDHICHMEPNSTSNSDFQCLIICRWL